MIHSHPAPPDDARIIHHAAGLARRDRGVRRKYGLGIVGWLTLSYQLVQLILDLAELLGRRRQIAETHPGIARVQAYQFLVNNGADQALCDALDEAEVQLS